MLRFGLHSCTADLDGQICSCSRLATKPPSQLEAAERGAIREDAAVCVARASAHGDPEKNAKYVCIMYMNNM